MKKNLAIKTRLTLLTLGVVLGLLALSLLSHDTINHVKIGSHLYEDIREAQEVIADVLPPPQFIIEPYLYVLQLANSADPVERQRLLSLCKVAKSHYESRHEYWTKAELPQGTLKDALLVDSYEAAREFFTILEEKLFPAVGGGAAFGDLTPVLALLREPFQRHRNAVDALVFEATTRVRTTEEKAALLVKSRVLWLAFTAAALAVAVTLLTRHLGRGVLRAMSDVAAGLEALAKRDLTKRIEIISTNETGQIATAMNEAIQGLSTGISDIGRNAQTLAHASGNIAAISQQLSTSAEETSVQASSVSMSAEQVSRSVQTVATGVEEMNASIKDVARNANQAASVATDAVRMAEKTNATVTKLGESGREIGNVIRVINSIAEQTNLLALNAAIEAARAGETGKGFAVVANEVKDLARKTAKATEEIGRKIEAIQGDTQSAVEAIVHITGVIGQINDIQNTIATAVEEQAATVNEIGRNASEAASGSNEIATSITSVASAVKNTTEGAANTQQAAQQIAKMAVELEKFVAQFQC